MSPVFIFLRHSDLHCIVHDYLFLGTPRSEGRNTPRSMGHRTPRYDNIANDLERTRMKNVGRSPRSVRSTPRTNTSPHSMSLGDATPLYDESI